MKMKILPGILIYAALALSGAYSADHNTWMNYSLEYRPLKGGAEREGDVAYACLDGIILKANEELKFGAGLTDSETMLQFGYEFSPYFTLLAGHRIVCSRSARHARFSTEQRPTLETVFTSPEFLTLKADLRSRFELRDRKGARPYMRYRNRLRLRTSWNCTRFKVSPYLSDEVFFSDKHNADSSNLFDRNRAVAGVSFRPIPSIKNFSCSLYYMVQHNVSEKASRWEPLNVFGFEASMKF